MKLFSFVFFILVLTFFIGFNLENRCDISLIFYTFQDVPIFMSLLLAFSLGILAVIPYLFGSRKKPAVKKAESPVVRGRSTPIKGGTVATADDSEYDRSPRYGPTAAQTVSSKKPEPPAKRGIGAFFGFGSHKKAGS